DLRGRNLSAHSGGLHSGRKRLLYDDAPKVTRRATGCYCLQGSRGCRAHGFAWACRPRSVKADMPTQSRGHGTREMKISHSRADAAAPVVEDVGERLVEGVCGRPAGLGPELSRVGCGHGRVAG